MPFDIDTLNNRYPSDNSEILAAFARWCEMVRAHSLADDAIEAAHIAGEIDRIETNAQHAAHYDEQMDLRDAMLRMPVAGAPGLAVKLYLILQGGDGGYPGHDPAAITRERIEELMAEPLYDDLARFIPDIPAVAEVTLGQPRGPIIV